MFYQLSKNENGEYKKDNEIVDLLKCNRSISKEGVNIGIYLELVSLGKYIFKGSISFRIFFS